MTPAAPTPYVAPYVEPAPVYAAPAPEPYYAPQPAYYEPAPAYVEPVPAYVEPAPYVAPLYDPYLGGGDGGLDPYAQFYQ